MSSAPCRADWMISAILMWKLTIPASISGITRTDHLSQTPALFRETSAAETAHRMASLRLHTNRKMPHLSAKNYASDVRYFMPFAYNVGIHDASWRSTFGKEIYKTSGSHGCINVPPKKAKKLFQTLQVGTPVIAYYREPVTLTAENTRISNAYSYKAETGL